MFQVTRQAGPSGAGCGVLARSGAGDAGGTGKLGSPRPAFRSDFPAQPSPEVSYRSTSERDCECPRGTLVLMLRSGHARRHPGSQDANRANPELFFHFAGPQLLLVKKRWLGQQNLFRQ